MKSTNNNTQPENQEDKEPLGLSPYHVRCKMMFYTLTKIAAAYHREYFPKEVKMWEDNSEMAAKLQKHNAKNITQTIQQLKRDHDKMQSYFRGIHQAFERELTKIKGASSQFNFFFNYINDANARLFTIDRRVEVIKLLDMFRKGEFDAAFEALNEAEEKAIADAGAEKQKKENKKEKKQE